VMPSLISELSDGSRLQYAVADFLTAKGKQLEGVGVKPDVPVELTRANLAGGTDPMLTAALHALSQPPSQESTP